MTFTDFFDARLFMSATITLVVIMDPPGTVPVFLSLVGRKSVVARARAARQAVLVSLLVISLFAVAGQAILAYLGIGIPALQGAGGLLLLLISLHSGFAAPNGEVVGHRRRTADRQSRRDPGEAHGLGDPCAPSRPH